jgi:Zn-finger nucleic acid-binding protein
MSLNCPACTKELSVYKDDLTSLEIDSCFYCHGLWFDYNELRRFFTAPKLFNKFRLPQYNFKVKIKDPPAQRLCPRCENAALTEVKLGEVVVDECSSCKGVWLDSGEITRLVDLYEEGKLKGKSETAKQIRKGHFDQGPIGQVSKTVALAFKMLF